MTTGAVIKSIALMIPLLSGALMPESAAASFRGYRNAERTSPTEAISSNVAKTSERCQVMPTTSFPSPEKTGQNHAAAVLPRIVSWPTFCGL